MKKVVASVVGFVVGFFIATSSACGPDWGDCKSCIPGEASVEAVDTEEQIPVDVNVTVIVDVDQYQAQAQTQTQSQSQTQDAGVDAGKPDSGTPDAGKPDGGTCRKVCVCMAKVWKCDGKYYSKKQKHCKSCKQVDKCLKEEVKCN